MFAVSGGPVRQERTRDATRVDTVSRPLRIALVSYRSKPHVGGQGVYLRHLSRELAALGHQVEVFSGQPYPELDPGPVLREVPSLDLYREPDPFRWPALREYRDWIDAYEVAAMRTGAFPEPLTFSWRARRALLARRGDFDLVHDNQVLAYGLLALPRAGLPLVTSIHHPISVDRRIELAAAHGAARFFKRRWYSFVRMQAQVARRCDTILTASQASADDICRDFRVDPAHVRLVPLGADTRLFHPRPGPRVPGRIVAVASADSPIKGVPTLVEAVAKLSTERDVQLIVVGKPAPGGPTEKLVAQLSLGDRVQFRHGITDTELAELTASAEMAVVPSRYEGFSLPAVEHMASGTPLVASRAGALPEVTGDAAVLVPPGDAEALTAALRRLLDSPAERERLSRAAWQRVQERFTWEAVARATVAEYQRTLAAARAGGDGAPASTGGSARPAGAGIRTRAAQELAAGHSADAGPVPGTGAMPC
jgi:glycosyltransferase involved in cell wall biosynthesis